MFLFECCQTASSNSGYQIVRKNKNSKETTTFVNSLKNVPIKDLDNLNVQILQL
jgi:hypothetical protein